VIRSVNELCGELAPHARTLVEAFGVPEAALGAAAGIGGA
ncbi:MAG: Acyl-CoA oxidase, partial [Solirubrobacteraceae bacterium]|nr:Acyl-CoA oxidase [Solirubrobacteraceae bacterium]